MERGFERNLARIYERADTPRLSGIQIKAAMYVDISGTISPSTGKPFTHILKPAGASGFESLPVIEWSAREPGAAEDCRTGRRAVSLGPVGAALRHGDHARLSQAPAGPLGAQAQRQGRSSAPRTLPGSGAEDRAIGGVGELESLLRPHLLDPEAVRPPTPGPCGRGRCGGGVAVRRGTVGPGSRRISDPHGEARPDPVVVSLARTEGCDGWRANGRPNGA